MPRFGIFLYVLLVTCIAAKAVALAPRRPGTNGKPAGKLQAAINRLAEGLTGAVAADDGRCADIGRDIMKDEGGNAVDAAVAVALCEGVVNPMASGIGGGGFLLFLPANAPSPLAYDFREVAPAAASENMYNGNSELKLEGALSVAVPGEVAGLHLLWQQYGTLPWKTLIEPAINFAENGFEVKPCLAAAISLWSSHILADKGLSEVFAPNGTLLVAGDICVCTALAATLTSIALEGPAAFYNGSVGENLINDLTNAGGIVTMDDLAAYSVKIRDPIEQDVQGLTIYGMPPPSSGGATLAMVLNILAAYPDPREAVSCPLGLHRMVEAFKYAYAYRMNISDPDFVDVTDIIGRMLNTTLAAKLQNLINDNRTYPPKHYDGSGRQLDDHGTCHVNIVDGDRNVVALTTTINLPFGARILSRSTGILMNDEMDDFSMPTNVSGDSPPASVNFIQPYKRPISSMSPIIVMKDGKFLGALGGSGGARIITAVVQVFLNSFWKGYDPLLSVSSPRLHHQLFPDKLEYEDWETVEGELIEEPEEVVEFLESRGHNMTVHAGGSVQLIVQNNSVPVISNVRSGRIMREMGTWKGMLTAVSDLRKDGSPSAF